MNLIWHLEKMHTKEHVEFIKRCTEIEQQTPKRLLKQTTLDRACPYSWESETARGGTRKLLEFIVLSELAKLKRHKRHLSSVVFCILCRICCTDAALSWFPLFVCIRENMFTPIATTDRVTRLHSESLN